LQAPTGVRGVANPFAGARALGLIGAVLLIAGLVMVGSSLVVLAGIEQSEINCIYNANPNTCISADDNGANQSVTTEVVVGVGVLIAGVGGGLAFGAMVAIMARREALYGPPPPPGSRGPGTGMPMPPYGPTPPPPPPVPPV
jgi:hypothetical protein